MVGDPSSVGFDPTGEEEQKVVNTTVDGDGEQEIDMETRAGLDTELNDALDAFDKTVVEPKQLTELKEWRDGEFKESMREIIEAQQEICAEEKGADSQECVDGKRIWEEMFGEPWKADQAA
jgi:hypothetical protein